MFEHTDTLCWYGDRGQLARISFLFPFCARTQTQFFRPGGKHLPLLNHLAGPQFLFSFQVIFWFSLFLWPTVYWGSCCLIFRCFSFNSVVIVDLTLYGLNLFRFIGACFVALWCDLSYRWRVLCFVIEMFREVSYRWSFRFRRIVTFSVFVLWYTSILMNSFCWFFETGFLYIVLTVLELTL